MYCFDFYTSSRSKIEIMKYEAAAYIVGSEVFFKDDRRELYNITKYGVIIFFNWDAL
jgi:hypothetical protein